MRSYGLPNKKINVMKVLYDGPTSCVRVGQANTDSFEITSGVKQGDVLSPDLFIVVVDWIMRRVVVSDDGNKWVYGTRLSKLAYADDVALLSEDAEAMIRLTEKFLREAAKV